MAYRKKYSKRRGYSPKRKYKKTYKKKKKRAQYILVGRGGIRL